MQSVRGLRGAAIVVRAGSVEVAASAVDTRFQVASVSKTFVATAALLLVEQNVVDLQEPIARWLPDAPDRFGAITLHQLLTHTSGMSHWGSAPGFDVFAPMPVEQRLGLFTQAPLLAPTHRYSSPGYIVAGAVLERAYGQPYRRLLTDQVIGPLGLTSTSVGLTPTGPDVAQGHPPSTVDLAGMPGTGDVWSTVGDLARFNTAVHSGGLLSGESRRLMSTPQVPANPDGEVMVGAAYGYGVFVGSIGGHTAYFHPGDVPGYVSLNVWLPEYDASMVILTNDESTDLDDIVVQLLPKAVNALGS